MKKYNNLFEKLIEMQRGKTINTLEFDAETPIDILSPYIQMLQNYPVSLNTMHYVSEKVVTTPNFQFITENLSHKFKDVVISNSTISLDALQRLSEIIREKVSIKSLYLLRVLSLIHI